VKGIYAGKIVGGKNVLRLLYGVLFRLAEGEQIARVVYEHIGRETLFFQLFGKGPPALFVAHVEECVAEILSVFEGIFQLFEPLFVPARAVDFAAVFVDEAFHELAADAARSAADDGAQFFQWIFCHKNIIAHRAGNCNYNGGFP